MKNIIIASLLTFTACTSAPQRVTEPTRSHFIVTCVLKGGVPVTACLCFEQKLIEMKGTNMGKYNQLDMAVAQQKCTEELGPSLRKEIEATQQEIQIEPGSI